jgi:hypothetical protein
MTKFNYYYNNVPNHGKCRNNLIYTSLISEDQKTFCQWYYNDTEYHRGMNQVVDTDLMELKWDREIKFLTMMKEKFPSCIPNIVDINYTEKKIYLEIDGPDFWEKAGCLTDNFDSVLPDWREQMIDIYKCHRSLNLWKYSLHPSSYFLVDGKLKSINYFFTYQSGEGPITVREHLSHISEDRQKEMKSKTDQMGIDWDAPQTLETMQILTFESFKNNYPIDFIERAKRVFI